MTRAVLWIAAALLACGVSADAQTEDLPEPPAGYQPIVPEAIEAQLDKTRIDSKLINIRWGLAPILDYTWFSQDQPSIDQVGIQEDAFQVRSGRVMARGTFFNHWARPWRFLVSFEYRGFDSNPDDTWSWTDVMVAIPLPKLGLLSIGKEKEGFSYEIVGDAANLVQVERLMNAFAGTRNVGLKLSNTALGERATWSLGVFNDWFQQHLDFDESGTQVVGRITALPFWTADGRRYLHLGAAWRRNGESGVGLVNMGSVPVLATSVSSALASGASIEDAAQSAAADADPQADLNASVEYRTHLAKVLVRRALEEASA